MIGKKKATFFILCEKDGVKYLEELDGWTKDGIGYSKGDFTRWGMTDLASGCQLPNAYDTLDEAEANYLHNKEKVIQKRDDDRYRELVKVFNNLKIEYMKVVDIKELY